MKQTMKKKLAILLVFTMLFSLVPITALAADTTTIDTINIKGITAPVAGEAPVITGINTDTAGITLTNIQWQKGSSVLNSTNKFEAGQTYNLWIRYAISEGYEISDAVTVTSDLENSTNDIDTARRIVHIWYTVPAAPKYTVTVTGGGTVEGKASVTTEAGTRLQLRAPEVSGKRFTGWSGLDGITFYGDNAKVTDPILQFIMPAKNLTVTANYQDAVEITTVNIKGITKPLAGANPVKFGVTTDTTGLSVEDAIWYFDETSSSVPYDYEFQLGDKIKLLVWLKVADGYTFADTVNITADLEYTAAYRRGDTVYLEYTVKDAAHTHNWGTVTYTWDDGSSCTAERVCTEDENHKETATATITSAVKIPATETVKGTTTYTATFAEAWADTQTKDIQDIPTHKHTYSTEWSKDATYHWYASTCGHDVVDAKAVHVYDNSKDATCNVCSYTRIVSSGEGTTGTSGSGGGFSGSYNYPVNADKVTGAYVTLSDEHATAGETVTITVKPEAGKKVDEVIVTDADGDVIPVTKAGDHQYTFTMPAGKVNVAVTTKAAAYSQRIVMQINNNNIVNNNSTITNDVAPVIVGDRTLVPIRVVTELLGGSADWDNDSRTVTLKIDGKVLSMTIGREIPGFGTSAVIMNDRTYVPVRYVMEMLGANVEWINATRQIIIEK